MWVTSQLQEWKFSLSGSGAGSGFLELLSASTRTSQDKGGLRTKEAHGAPVTGSGLQERVPLLPGATQEGRLRGSVATYERCSFTPLASGLFAMSIPRWCWGEVRTRTLGTTFQGCMNLILLDCGFWDKPYWKNLCCKGESTAKCRLVAVSTCWLSFPVFLWVLLRTLCFGVRVKSMRNLYQTGIDILQSWYRVRECGDWTSLISCS